MGSDGATGGGRRYKLLRWIMNDADFVDDRTGPFGFMGGQRGSEGTTGGKVR